MQSHLITRETTIKCCTHTHFAVLIVDSKLASRFVPAAIGTQSFYASPHIIISECLYANILQIPMHTQCNITHNHNHNPQMCGCTNVSLGVATCWVMTAFSMQRWPSTATKADSANGPSINIPNGSNRHQQQLLLLFVIVVWKLQVVFTANISLIAFDFATCCRELLGAFLNAAKMLTSEMHSTFTNLIAI